MAAIDGNKVDPNDPSNESSDYCAMKPAWELIDDICAGVPEIKHDTGMNSTYMGVEQTSSKARRYLPKFTRESERAYRWRLAMAPWRPEFTDALRALCSKPFQRMVKVNEDAPDDIQGKLDESTKRRSGGFVDDVDGRGNSLHVFSRETFVNGVKRGLAAIYVTFPNVEPARTQAEEKAAGARPYWVQIDAPNILALYLRNVNGRTVVEHIRFRECTVVRDRFVEAVEERIRIVELDAAGKPTSWSWLKNADGKYAPETPEPLPLTGVDEIPVALFFTGERSGNYRVTPPLLDLAEMQIELYRALSNEEQILTYAGSPMLKMVGMRPPQATAQLEPGQLPPPRDQHGVPLVPTDPPAPQMEIGPSTIIWCPPEGNTNPDADYIQPAADNIRVIGERIKGLTEDFRRLAMQPLAARSGNMTATGAAIEGAKSHSAIEAWANGLQDALNQALVYTCEWMGIADTVTASVHTDFGVDIGAQYELDALQKAKDGGTISEQTHFEELQRRDVVEQNRGWDEEEERKAEEADALAPEQPIDPRTGMPITPMPAPPPPANDTRVAA